ncbi:hypothetical protein IV203_025272 [Nitzschia inconspicua]|uniref:Uncharacterized protein n=1 Tax=Nitzschia inconspicua TaxID=303405 RepID=A0A9K3LIS2_9STRA|nr:hypothetical protein IV203_024723 [Nitzschia inconspicua]KAG7362388.1 hypothetical protein IV203_025272 [Nitzschia inconspicua]
MNSSASCYNEKDDVMLNMVIDIDTESQQETNSNSTIRRRERLLSFSTSTNNMTSVALDWTCMLATVSALLVVLGFSWHTLQPSHNNGDQRQVQEQRVLAVAAPVEEPFLSEQTATASRVAPHSMADFSDVITKTLFGMSSTEDGFYQSGRLEDGNQGQRVLDDECIINVKIEASCDGCEDWIAQSELQEWPWCHSELSSMTFLYTGCPCGSRYSIDYENSAWNNATGQTLLAYECWQPASLSNTSDVPPEITCQDYSLPTLNNRDEAVKWVITSFDDPTVVVGSGVVSVGQEYTVSSGDPGTPLPPFLTLTFYDQVGNMLQSTNFPSDYCPGYPDPWYREGYSQTHIVQVQNVTSGTISTRDTLKEALWLKITVDASQSPVPVRLQELNVIANINTEPINLTDTVNGVELSGNGDDEWIMMTRDSDTRSTGVRSRIHSLFHSRYERIQRSETMTMMVGPMTIDMYWRTKYSFFGTIVATQSNNDAVQCNGFDIAEYIEGLQ